MFSDIDTGPPRVPSPGEGEHKLSAQPDLDAEAEGAPASSALFLSKAHQNQSLFNNPASVPLSNDARVVVRLLEELLDRGGLSSNDMARRLGVTPNAVRQYIVGRRSNPSLLWFVKFVEVCGGRLWVEFPRKQQK